MFGHKDDRDEGRWGDVGGADEADPGTRMSGTMLSHRAPLPDPRVVGGRFHPPAGRQEAVDGEPGGLASTR